VLSPALSFPPASSQFGSQLLSRNLEPKSVRENLLWRQIPFFSFFPASRAVLFLFSVSKYFSFFLMSRSRAHGRQRWFKQLIRSKLIPRCSSQIFLSSPSGGFLSAAKGLIPFPPPVKPKSEIAFMTALRAVLKSYLSALLLFPLFHRRETTFPPPQVVRTPFPSSLRDLIDLNVGNSISAQTLSPIAPSIPRKVESLLPSPLQLPHVSPPPFLFLS